MSDGESSERLGEGDGGLEVAVVSFDRNREEGEEVAEVLGGEFLPYEKGVFEEAWGRDVVVAIMSSGIVLRKVAPLMDDKWEDAAVLVVDRNLEFAVPALGGHHGGNEVAKRLAGELGMVPVLTTATEAAGRWSVERLASEMGGEVENRDSTVKTNMAALKGDLPVERIDGPKLLLVDEATSVVRRRGDGLSVGVGCRKGVDAVEVEDAVEEVLDDEGLPLDRVELLASGELKEEEEGLLEAADEMGFPLLFLDRESLERHEGPTESRARELTGWPGIAEASALAASGNGELLVEKRAVGNVTVAVAR